MMQFAIKTFPLFRCLISLFLMIPAGMHAQYSNTREISQDGYTGCIEMTNSNTRVVLDPNVGGRVLRYELNGRNILYEDPSMDGKLYKEGEEFGTVSAGRIDIGPQQTTPLRPALFFGSWKAKITDEREVTMVSLEDTATGVQLMRYFSLDAKTSRLRIRQVICNYSADTVRYCYWGRSFVKGGGISLTPLNPHSRFPQGYIIHGPGNVMDFLPAEEPNVRVRNGILEIIGPPGRQKFGMDSYPGWLAYIGTNDLLFIKTFPVYPHRVYGEMAGYTTSVWYNGEEMVEIEPYGPLEIIPPGDEASFSVNWFLREYKYPSDRLTDLSELRVIISGLQ